MRNHFEKLLGCYKKLEKYLNIISKIAFYIALFIELTIVILDKSEYIIQYEGLWFRVTFLLFGLSLVTTKRDLKQWIWFGIFAVIGFISYKSTGRNEILRWVVFIWACYGKDMKKVLKFTFWYTALGCLLIFLLSILGIYGEVSATMIYRMEEAWVYGVEETRYFFGMGHPNAFHCMMLVITWLGLYCYHEKIKWYGYLILGIFHVLIYSYTDSRTGLLMAGGTIILTLTFKYIKLLSRMKISYIFGILVVVGTVLVSTLIAKYSVFHPLLEKIDGLLSHRILNLYYNTVNHEGMLHTWSLWSTSRNNYYFDLGIVRFFYWYGIIPGIIYFVAQCKLIWCGYKKKDYMMLVLLTLISIYSVFEAHFISDYMGRNYILFFFGMYLTEMVGSKSLEKCGENSN